MNGPLDRGEMTERTHVERGNDEHAYRSAEKYLKKNGYYDLFSVVGDARTQYDVVVFRVDLVVDNTCITIKNRHV